MVVTYSKNMIDREALAKEWEELLRESSKIQSRIKALDLAFRSTTDELAELYLREDITGPVKTCIEGIDHVLFDLNQKVYLVKKDKGILRLYSTVSYSKYINMEKETKRNC